MAGIHITLSAHLPVFFANVDGGVGSMGPSVSSHGTKKPTGLRACGSLHYPSNNRLRRSTSNKPLLESRPPSVQGCSAHPPTNMEVSLDASVPENTTTNKRCFAVPPKVTTSSFCASVQVPSHLPAKVTGASTCKTVQLIALRRSAIVPNSLNREALGARRTAELAIRSGSELPQPFGNRAWTAAMAWSGGLVGG